MKNVSLKLVGHSYGSVLLYYQILTANEFEIRNICVVYFDSVSKCMDGWVVFERSCYLLSYERMDFVEAKVCNDVFLLLMISFF